MPKLDYLHQKKLTPADELRELLDNLAERQPKVKGMTSTQALILMRDLDQLYALFNQLEARGLDLTAERGRFETIQARLRAGAGPLLKALGGPAALAEFRPSPAPDRERWWWYIHEEVAAQRKRSFRRITVGLTVVLLILTGLAVAFKTFLAPSPEVVARVETENQAYSFIEEGDYQAALTAVEAGLAQAPSDPSLILLQGVLLDTLGQTDAASRSFEQVQAALSSPVTFYLGRGQLELRMNQPEKAERDARTALEIDDDQPRAWLLLAQSLEFQGRSFLAIPAYEKAGQLALDQGDNQVVVMARLALSRLGGGVPSQ